MYFLSAEERQRLLKGLLPKARELEIADDLRGWNWNQPPLEPVYDVQLGVYEVAGRYCSTARDLYLRRVEGVRVPANQAMLRGKTLHQVLADVLVAAKRLCYAHGPDRPDQIGAELTAFADEYHSDAPGSGADNGLAGLEEEARNLAKFEADRVTARLRDVLIRQPHIGVDSLVAQAIPVVVEQRLDGSYLGLSQHLSADAYTVSEPMVLDLKFGQRQAFHRLSTTGYALAMEAAYGYPVNLGCVVYADVKGSRVTVDRDFHIIDDELRQWFLEERDEKARLIHEQLDPGVAATCSPACPYVDACGVSGNSKTTKCKREQAGDAVPKGG